MSLLLSLLIAAWANANNASPSAPYCTEGPTEHYDNRVVLSARLHYGPTYMEIYAGANERQTAVQKCRTIAYECGSLLATPDFRDCAHQFGGPPGKNH